MLRNVPAFLIRLALGVLLLTSVLGTNIPALHAQAVRMPPYAPPTPTRFETLSLEDGLSQNAVLDLLQDRQGYLWVATQDGLNRYDGYSFTVYKNDPDDENSLSLNSALQLYEDEAGIIWIGTWGGGLNRLNPQTNHITRFRHDPTDPNSLSNDLVAAIAEDGHGYLWLGTMGGGLSRFDRITKTFTNFRHDPQNPHSIASDYVGAIYEDGEGKLWIGTGGFGTPGAGLDRFDPLTGRFTHYRHDPNDAASLSSDTISAIHPDEDGKLWVATGGFSLAGDGLNLFDPATGRTTRFVHDAGDPAGLSSNNVMSIYTDSQGQTWFGTWGGGLELLQRSDSGIAFVHHRKDPFLAGSLSADIVWPILEDRSGVLWVGTINGGLNKINPEKQRLGLHRNHPDDPNSLSFDVIGGFYEDRQGGLWVGTWGGGLNLFDRAAGKFTRYVNDPNDPDSLSDNTVSTVYEDADGAIWVGTFAGLDKLDRAAGKFTHYSHNPDDPASLVNDGVYTILPAGENKMWVGTLGGLDLYDPATGEFTHFRHDPADPASLPDDQITELYQSPSGVLWIGTWHGGMAYLDPQAWAQGEARFVRFQHDPADPSSLSDNGVWAIHEDSNGIIWAGTQAGLNRLDPQTGKFTHYLEKDGLPNSSVTCIQEDESGNLWLSTNNGLVRLNPAELHFRTYDVSHGLQSNEFNSGACLRSRNGEMYYGGVHGFNAFQPAAIRDNPNPPPVVLSGFRIFNRPTVIDLSGRTPIELEHQENFISFEFAALDFHAPHKNQYAYRLEGFDPDWVDAGDRRYANYTNLPAGNYLFRVRGSNNDGVWNETGIALPVRVAPPLWQTWWFQTAALLMVAALLAGGFRWRVHQVRAQNRRLEQTVAQQTADLRREMEQRRQAEAALAHKAAGEAVAAERTRLARELHDAVTQTLFSASLIAEVLPDLYAANLHEGQQSTEELRQLTRGALAEMRTLLLELRPSAVTQARLEDLIRQLIEATTGRARLPVQYHAQGQRPIPDDVKIAIYRIAQEALNNIVKYAKASQVTVDLRQHSLGVRLTVSDDGVGFDPAAVGVGHLGQKIMRERAEGIGARLAVHSEMGEGTIVTVIWMDPECQEGSG
jgi:signal transduction histidine kinase/ligand-binding sensor domain-containing protein